ncbi:MAG: hypothetical protein U1E47_01280 [Rivihabitans pingtungensis]
MIDDHAVLDASADAVGGKAWQLAQLRRYGLPVAEFIVLPAAAAAQLMKPNTPGRRCRRAAGRISRWRRSSAVGENSAHASFAGIHRSCLNVCGAAPTGRGNCRRAEAGGARLRALLATAAPTASGWALPAKRAWR